MIRFVLMSVAFLVFAMIALALLAAAVMFLVLACAVGMPLYLMLRGWMGRHGIAVPVQSRIDRLKNLYLDGKIDLFEFERRVAQLISVEQ